MTELAAVDVVAAATQLMRAAQWDAATSLLAGTRTDDPGERLALAVARAVVAIDQDFWQRTDHGQAALTAAKQLLDGSPEPAWDLEFAAFRRDYSAVAFTSAKEPGDLRARSLRLIESAPDEARQAAISFWAGVLADNVLDEPEAAYGYYTSALQLGEKSGDELTMSYALRHLGDHAHTAGDLELARAHWERSTELRQKAGHVPGALAQQTLLALLLRDEDDAEGSRAVATEVNRWARQLDLQFIAAETAGLST
ncbi:hypothetical protein AB0E69_09505 [Kribbella sp. NPDC026611]|uniref:hypothetical protein n=1 Tax=Kribbella sp. NPDC026611 TaxID=3154911 RepID=UPI003410274B